MLTHHDSGNLQDFLGLCGLPKVTNPVAATTEVAEINSAISPESDDLSLSRDASTLHSMKFWRAGTLLSPLQIAGWRHHRYRGGCYAAAREVSEPRAVRTFASSRDHRHLRP